MTAASVALALSAGVILGEYVAQPLKREAAASRAGWPVRAWSARCRPANRSSQARSGRTVERRAVRGASTAAR